MNEPKFTIKIDTESQDYGKFVIEPLEQGYGHTIGNSIRRVLLTSLKGAAVTKIKIEGVKHPFSTMDGLKEDMIELSLNIKKIRFKLQSDKPVVAKLSVKGPAQITAADLEVAEAEVVNPEQYIGELTSNKAKMNMELTIEPGFGYVTAEEHEIEKELGTIVLDSLYSPVVRVNYKVEATRVGRMTNLDKLIMEIWTDGTVTPMDAMQESAKTLVSYFQFICEPHAKSAESVAVLPSVSDEVMKMTLEELDLPTRIVNALHNGGIETIGQLLTTPKKVLYKIKNLGAKSVNNIEDLLKEKGINLSA